MDFGFGIWVLSLGFEVLGFEFWVQGFRSRVFGLGVRVPDIWRLVSGLELLASGFGLSFFLFLSARRPRPGGGVKPRFMVHTSSFQVSS